MDGRRAKRSPASPEIEKGSSDVTAKNPALPPPPSSDATPNAAAVRPPNHAAKQSSRSCPSASPSVLMHHRSSVVEGD
nr:hypothetical protein Iba_scaffold14288CG0010 [Ipomoea batatas]